MIPLRRLLVAATFVLLSTGGRNRKPPAVPPQVLAGQVAAASDRAEGIAQLEALAADRSQPDLQPWAQVWAGEARRVAGDADVARGWFEAAAGDHPTHVVKDAAILGMALVDAQAHMTGNTLATLQLMDPAVAPDTMRADRLRILARTAANEGTPGKRVREMAEEALRWAAADPVVEQRVRLVLADLLPRADGSRPDAVMRIDPETGDPLPPQAVALAAARDAMARDELDAVIRQADALIASWPDSDEAAQAGWLKQRAEAGDPTVAGRVGVLLPLTGEYAPPAQRLRDAITLANDRAGKPLDLVFRDTAGDPDTALDAARDLVLAQGCVALIGPLHRDAVAAAAPAAQGMGVPMVALTQSGDPTKVGEYVYRGFLSLESQVDALLDHATAARGFTRFAVLHPSNAYGEQARDLFVSAAGARGVSVTQIVSYDPTATDFREQAQQLGQKDYVQRSDEYRKLKKAAVERHQDPDKVVLPPIIDFDAIFIPDNYRRAALVASSLAYEEFPIGVFRPRTGDAGVTLLGLNAWNNDAIIESGGEYMRDAVFVDAFDADANDPAVVAFVDAYTMAFERRPIVLDAVAYDAASVLSVAVQAGGQDRDEIRKQLHDVRLMTPVTGAVGFNDAREVDRKLLVLTVGSERIEPWAPPEALLPPEGLPSDGSP